MRSLVREGAGFTLIELMIVLAIAGILALIALPAFNEQIRKSRRSEAIARVAAVWQVQERWRANNASYGTLANTGLPETVPNGFYTLSVANSSSSGYQVIAQAIGAQVADTNCVFMRSTAASGAIAFASGPTNGFGNAESANNRCWNR